MDLNILFVDDYSVLYRPGTKRVLRQLDRCPQNPVIPDDKPWEEHIGYCSVHRDSQTGGYRMWYQAAPGCHLCYAASDDGIKWNKPNLGIVPFEGDTDTNIVMKTDYGAGVLVDCNGLDPARRYKIAYWENHGMSIAFSPDGIHWTKHPSAPVLPGSFGVPQDPPFHDDADYRWGHSLSVSDVVDSAYDPVRRKYMVYAKTWIDGPDGQMFWKRAVVRSDSADYIHWSKPVLVMAPDEFDGTAAYQFERKGAGGGSRGVQIHSAPAFYYNDRFFSLMQVMDTEITGEMPIELGLSRDGIQWERPFRDRMFLPVTRRKDDFDGGVIWTNATPVFLEDSIRYYYGAYAGNWKTNKELMRTPTGVGFASMPRDRFAGIRPLSEIGQITLKPVCVDGASAISLNADASGGKVRVEVLNEEGRRVRGFSREDALPVHGDSLTNEVGWKQKRIADIPPGKYLFRVHLDNAMVYALTIR